jgi:hypothetical protein
MKKWIFSAVFMIALSGYAAAQTKNKVASPTKQQGVLKKGPASKNGITKQPGKADSVNVKLPMIPPVIDTSGMLTVKEGKQYLFPFISLFHL